MRLDLPERLYPDDRQRAGFYAAVLGGLSAAPGIESAGVVTQVPADLGPIPRRSFDIEGRTTLRPEERLVLTQAGRLAIGPVCLPDVWSWILLHARCRIL